MGTTKYISYRLAILFAISFFSCTKLNQEVYSVVTNENFWQTPEQIAAGIAPAYSQLTAIPNGNVFDLNEATSDEMVVPARGADWLGIGEWIQLWQHTYTAVTPEVTGAWADLYSGIGKINFILSIVDNISPAPPNIQSIDAELKVLRALYYYWAMDLYGNVPLVTDFKTNPNTVTNSSRQDLFNFIESELKANIDLVSADVTPSTYGRVTKWMAFTVLAKLYLNAEVYTGTPRWNDCVTACDSVIQSAKYSLQPSYFDNFSQSNEGSVENIFVVPFDNVNIGGNNFEAETLHYQSNLNFQLSGSPWNGYCINAEFYSHYDTSSVYTVKGQNTYRTYLDARSGQYLVGQQFAVPYSFPPSTNVLYASQDASLKIKDAQTGKFLSFYPNVTEISNPTDTFRLAGLRNIKYFPNPGTLGSQSNDIAIFRLADVLLMRAEADLRNGTANSTDLGYVNQVRERAYGGDISHDWTMGQLTLNNIFDERARELAWENVRRQDCIRFGTYGNARVPNKTADGDTHWQIFPIPKAQHDANPNLKQNPGYPAF